MSSIQSHHERGLSSGAAPVVVRLDVVSFPPRSSAPTVASCRLVDILLDVIGGVESVLREGCPRTTTGVSQRWFLVHFRHVFFNTIPLPRHNIGADVWGESSIMTGVYQRWCSSTLHGVEVTELSTKKQESLFIGWGLCDRDIVYVKFSSAGAVWGVVLLFILGSSLGGVAPVRGLRGEGRRGWCEE